MCFCVVFVCVPSTPELGMRAKGLSRLPIRVLLPLALSSPIKPATPQQYGAINYRHAAINEERRGEETRGRNT